MGLTRALTATLPDGSTLTKTGTGHIVRGIAVINNQMTLTSASLTCS